MKKSLFINIILIILLVILESISISILKYSSINNNKLFIISIIIYIIIILILYNIFKKKPAGITFTLWNIGAIIMTTLMGYIIFKEKLNKHQILGLIIAIISIPLLNYK
jgi:multidrug transporter EmrE-like cation transporter